MAILIVLNGLGWASTARADLNQLYIYTVEWLVDNSDAIVIIRAPHPMPDNGGVLADSLVVKQLKGGAYTQNQRIGRLGSYHHRPGYSWFHPKSEGVTRLLFIKDDKLLQAVSLDRHNKLGAYPSWQEAIFGVSQFGELLLNSSDFLRAIRSRIEEGPGTTLGRKGTHVAYEGVVAPPSFPLETNGETYVMVVPITEERRDYYIQLSQSGDASERLDALHELTAFADGESADAIRTLIGVEDVEPSYGPYRTYTAADVRRAAQKQFDPTD